MFALRMVVTPVFAFLTINQAFAMGPLGMLKTLRQDFELVSGYSTPTYAEQCAQQAMQKEIATQAIELIAMARKSFRNNYQLPKYDNKVIVNHVFVDGFNKFTREFKASSRIQAINKNSLHGVSPHSKAPYRSFGFSPKKATKSQKTGYVEWVIIAVSLKIDVGAIFDDAALLPETQSEWARKHLSACRRLLKLAQNPAQSANNAYFNDLDTTMTDGKDFLGFSQALSKYQSQGDRGLLNEQKMDPAQEDSLPEIITRSLGNWASEVIGERAAWERAVWVKESGNENKDETRKQAQLPVQQASIPTLLEEYFPQALSCLILEYLGFFITECDIDHIPSDVVKYRYVPTVSNDELLYRQIDLRQIIPGEMRSLFLFGFLSNDERYSSWIGEHNHVRYLNVQCGLAVEIILNDDARVEVSKSNINSHACIGNLYKRNSPWPSEFFTCDHFSFLNNRTFYYNDDVENSNFVDLLNFERKKLHDNLSQPVLMADLSMVGLSNQGALIESFNLTSLKRKRSELLEHKILHIVRGPNGRSLFAISRTEVPEYKLVEIDPETLTVKTDTTSHLASIDLDGDWKEIVKRCYLGCVGNKLFYIDGNKLVKMWEINMSPSI